MTDKEFSRIVNFMHSRFGIDLSEKKVIISGRMDYYLQTHGYSDYSTFMNEVELNPQSDTAQTMVDYLTTNHTYFMRESAHFDYFRDVVLPELRQRERISHDLRIWSAASSSGEEAYTLAMIVKDFLGLEYNLWSTEILATDISKKVLSEAIKGVYSAEQIAPVPPRWKSMYFKPAGADLYQISDEIRANVIFRHFNLMNPFPFKKKMHVIFLRNVMIYFDDATKKKLLSKIYEALEPGGYLFIGTTECIDRGSLPFEYVGPSVYRK